jgi:hypothetical protein
MYGETVKFVSICFLFTFYEAGVTGHKPVLENAIHDITELVHEITHSRERPHL